MKKLKLLLSISVMCLSLAVLCFGVLSATSVTYTISGTVSYEVTDVMVQIETKVYRSNSKTVVGRTTLQSTARSDFENTTFSTIDTTKYTLVKDSTTTNESGKIPVFTSSEKTSEGAATGIEINYNNGCQYYIVVNIRSFTSDKSAYAQITSSVSPNTNSNTYTTNYQNDIIKPENVSFSDTTNTGKNIVIAYGLTDPTNGISDSTTFSYTLKVEYGEVMESSVDGSVFRVLDETEKTASITKYEGNETNLIIPETVDLDIVPATTSFEISGANDRGWSAYSGEDYRELFANQYVYDWFMYDTFACQLNYADENGEYVSVPFFSFCEYGANFPSLINDTIGRFPVEVDFGKVTFNSLEEWQNGGVTLTDQNGNKYGLSESVNKDSSNVYSEMILWLQMLIDNVDDLLPDVVFKGAVEFDEDGYLDSFRDHGDSYDIELAMENLQGLIDCIDGMEDYESLFPIEISLNAEQAIAKEGSTYKVTGVDMDAFYGCDSLTSITIPKSVTSIVGNLFRGCTSLTSVEVDKNNETYHSSGNCIIETASKTLVAGLGNCLIPTDGSVTSIGEYALGDCTNLTSVTIPGSVESIGEYAFYGCESLTSVTIPGSVESIGEYAFYGCESLTSITVPESVTSIGSYAFSGCTGLRNEKDGLVYIKTVDNDCFYLLDMENTNLTSAMIDGDCRFVGSYAFSRCSITSITIPEGVKSIGDCAFSVCTSLTSITIPSSVESIGYYAFGYCTKLASITIPSSVTSVGKSAFLYCNKLTSVAFEDPTGWFVASSSSATSGTSLTLTDPSTNATYLTGTYGEEWWKKSN